RGQRPTCRLCDDENHFSNNCPTVRRNKEASNAKKSRGAQNSHVEEAANAEPTVTIQENAVLLTEPPEGVSLELSSEGNEAMETDNLTAINQLASPDIPPGQFLPTQAVIIPETESLGIPIHSVSTMDSTVPDTGNVVAIESDTDNASMTSNDYQTKTKKSRTKYLPTITDKNSRPGKPSQIPLPRK
ncbi:Uncharacterized protein APZ42_007086, partial [Daphnia magna]